uniref:Uncharacterized protein n=1 Tax=Setaria italica TaxID=4555 RepID=K4AKC1_SETIT
MKVRLAATCPDTFPDGVMDQRDMFIDAFSDVTTIVEP